jgi:competence protein ComEA
MGGMRMVGEPIRERLRSLEGRELVGLLAVAALVLGAIGFWYVRSLPSPVHIDAAMASGPESGSARGPEPPAEPTSGPSPGPIVVYVSGWVRNPGVYEFLPGDRVVDALERADGAKRGADLTSLNLAALLADGQQIVVGKLGGGGSIQSGITTGASGASGGGPININSATLEELESLPGIGPSLGQRILDYRDENGPFRSVDELLNVSGIGEKRLADIRDKVTV